MSQRHRPGLDYPYLACLQARAGEDLAVGDVVWCSASPSKRMTVTKAGALNAAAGANAVLFSVVKPAISGGRCLVSLIHHVKVGSNTAGNFIYLSDTPGAVSATAGTVSRVVGSATGDGYVFNGGWAATP